MRKELRNGREAGRYFRRLNLESLELRLLLASDFGDAPAPYRVLLADDGARHEAIGPQFGAARDAELNGAHSAHAHADDGSGVDDEDGVVFGQIRVGQSDAIATVMVQGASAGARLDAWIDFNGDGSWGGAREQIAFSRAVVNGSNAIRFEVPADLASGLTYARFRLSTAGSLLPFGAAADGEVEDYQLTLGAPSPSRTQWGVAELLSEHRGDDLQAHDLDRDGDVDLVSVSIINRTISWYENTGAMDFAQRTIYSAEAYPYDGPSSLEVADMDGDGDLDLLAAGHEPFSLGWLENDGQENFSLHTIVEPGTYSHLVRAGDVDGDGDMDVVSVVFQELFWFENNGNEVFVGHAVGAANFYSSRALELVDMDRDGDLDFQIDDADGVAWYANDHGEFERQSVWATNLYIVDAKVGDLDGDGDLDVVSTAGGKVRVHLNRHSGGLAGFDRFELQAFGDSSATLDLADLDGDGDQDIAAERIWFRNVGNGQFEYAQTLVQHVQIFQLIPADLDGDGDLDLVANESGQEGILWFENADYFLEMWGEPELPLLEHSAEQRRFRFYRREDVSEPLDVTIRIGGTAQLGVDYGLNGATLLGGGLARVHFPAGESEQYVTITSIDDSQFEFAETVEVSLVKQSHYVYYTYGSVVTIADGDPADWGDAPGPYRTLQAQGGARHGAVGPRLGSTRDAETDGQPTSDAGGDDEVGDPNGGIIFAPVRVGQQNASVTVQVGNAPAGARLDAWIDFDGDGSWGGEGEQIFDSVLVVGGAKALSFNVPSGARVGETYARFRLSSGGGLGIGGESVDGEVEDLVVSILPPSESPGLFAARSLDGHFTLFARNLKLGDMDGDGDLDFVTSGSGVHWYEMEGGQIIEDHLIAPADPLSSGTWEVELCDLDGDGDMDVLVNGHTTLLPSQGSGLFWLENDSVGEFEARVVANLYGGLSGLSVVDIDGDGDRDIVGHNYALWVLTNDGTQQFSSQMIRYVDEIVGAPLLNDFDADGDLDIIVGTNRYDAKRVLLLENMGGAQFYERIIAGTSSSITRVALADLDDDGDEDIVWSASGFGLNWTENKGGAQFATRDIGHTSFNYGDTLAIADINGDGKEDIVISNSFEGAGWWQRLESGEFVFHVASKYWMQSSDVGDVDGDGDLDLVGLRGAAPYSIQPSQFVWFENVSTTVSASMVGAAASENGTGSITYTLRRNQSTDRELTVFFSIKGSATFGVDFAQMGAATFSATQGTLVFPAGVDEVQLTILPLDDSLIESNETIAILLVPGPDYVETDATVLVGRIIDNEPGDFGDSPGPYPTLLADDGARHGNTGPRLGAKRDAESDGAPSAQAGGDDVSNGDDGDGVLFGEVRVGLGNALLYAYVANAPAGARLDAWVDFDGDGNWKGVAERVVVSAAVVAGLNEIRFAVPADAQSGATFARVRLSSQGGLGVTGAAADGEVEDHQIWIESPVGPGGPFAAPQQVAVGTYVDSIVTGDLDNDGDVDLVTVGYVNFSGLNQYFWHENTTNGFVRHEIPLSVYVGQIVQSSLVIADMNCDGWNDLVARGTEAFVILLNDQQGGFVAQPELPITAADNYVMNWVSVFDADSDGDNDILLQSRDGTDWEIMLLVNRGDATFDRERAAIGQIGRATVTDLDRDGDFDLVGTFQYSNAPAIGINDGSGQFTFRSVLEPPYFNSYYDVQPIDLDDDGDIDLLASGNLLNWFENRGSEGFELRWLPSGWSADSGTGARAADIDGDGRMDVVAGRVRTGEIAWYKNLGNGEFTRQTINARVPTQSVVIPVDLDQDGDLDVVSYDYNDTGFLWYENLSLLAGDYNTDGTVNTSDYSVWRDALGATGLVPFSGADGDGDGTVDQDDYLVWKANFGRVAAAVGGGGSLVSAKANEAVLLQDNGEEGTAGLIGSGKSLASSGTLGWTESVERSRDISRPRAMRARALGREAVVRPGAVWAKDSALLAWLSRRDEDREPMRTPREFSASQSFGSQSEKAARRAIDLALELVGDEPR